MQTRRFPFRTVAWVVLLAAGLWLAVGDRVLTRFAYAVERGRIQASNQELEELQSELPEVHAISRAFKLVAKVARPGVVHIRVGESERGALSEREIQERLRHLLEQYDRDLDDLSEEEVDKLREGMRDQVEHWLRRMPEPPGSGSGIVLDKEGYILTNNHVVEGRSNITVVLHDNREFEAMLVGTDPKTDLAVLKIDAPDVHPLAFGDSDKLEVGDWVLAVGAPFGLTHSVTHGIVSAKGRTRIAGVDIAYQDFIQTDAAINPGNSGGPLLNLRAEVVGVNTAIATHGERVNAGVAFTIPSNMAAKIARQLKKHGEVERGFLGVGPSEITQEDVEIFGLPNRRGVFVGSVLRDSPAAQAGLQVEDVILSINDAPMQNVEHFRAFVADILPGEQVHLRVFRDGQESEFDVRLARQPVDTWAPLTQTVLSREIERLGLSVRTLRAGMLDAFDESDRGVIVWKVTPGEPQPDLRVGELIVACDGKIVESVQELAEVVRDIPADKTVRLQILEPTGDRRIIHIKPRTSR